jgi:hypothetical protein
MGCRPRFRGQRHGQVWPRSGTSTRFAPAWTRGQREEHPPPISLRDGTGGSIVTFRERYSAITRKVDDTLRSTRPHVQGTPNLLHASTFREERCYSFQMLSHALPSGRFRLRPRQPTNGMGRHGRGGTLFLFRGHAVGRHGNIFPFFDRARYAQISIGSVLHLYAHWHRKENRRDLPQARTTSALLPALTFREDKIYPPFCPRPLRCECRDPRYGGGPRAEIKICRKINNTRSRGGRATLDLHI